MGVMVVMVVGENSLTLRPPTAPVREPPVKFGEMRMFSRLPRGLIDSYATSAASSFVALLCRDVDEDQENLFSKKGDCMFVGMQGSIYRVYLFCI